MLDIEEFGKKIDKKSRLLGVDPGKKRLGIAISDENKIIATPYTTIIKNNFSDFLKQINKVIFDYRCVRCCYNFIFIAYSYTNSFLTRVNSQ